MTDGENFGREGGGGREIGMEKRREGGRERDTLQNSPNVLLNHVVMMPCYLCE